ncbi:hypothetical protein GCM10022228_06510 [Halomonas cibimaris]|uniref:OmpA-like domain-containing protein n=1 Tax=Halomonas cibimaris TaxID=657012 RepID=A0ABP7LCZ6_9GAMM
MLEDHRTGLKHDTLLKAQHDDESDSAWMVSYIDIMTLLVALFVIIIVVAEATDPGWLTRSAPPPAPASAAPGPVKLGIPLPEALAARRAPAHPPGALAPAAINVALGVAGLPARRPAPPPLLARPDAQAAKPEALLPESSLPELLLAGAETTRPLADYMIVLTDHPPVNAKPLAPQALDGAPATRQPAEYLPDLEGVEATRVSEGINLRVQNKLLFDTAEAGLSDAGEAVVASLVDTIERYEGDVSVEGHSDSRSISTEQYPSNWALSSARAIAIVQALEDAGVAPGRLRAVGLAATRPLADNATADGRARNRRVEVVIHVE